MHCPATNESEQRVSLVELDQMELPGKPDMKEGNQRCQRAQVHDLNQRGRSPATTDKGICHHQTQQGGSRQVLGPKNSLIVIT